VNLCPNLSVAENIFAGRYPRRGLAQGGRIDWAAVHQRARELLARIGLSIDVSSAAGDLSRWRCSRWWPLPAR
jgi:monosaccharide-transporting ATPase